MFADDVIFICRKPERCPVTRSAQQPRHGYRAQKRHTGLAGASVTSIQLSEKEIKSAPLPVAAERVQYPGTCSRVLQAGSCPPGSSDGSGGEGPTESTSMGAARTLLGVCPAGQVDSLGSQGEWGPGTSAAKSSPCLAASVSSPHRLPAPTEGSSPERFPSAFLLLCMRRHAYMCASKPDLVRVPFLQDRQAVWGQVPAPVPTWGSRAPQGADGGGTEGLPRGAHTAALGLHRVTPPTLQGCRCLPGVLMALIFKVARLTGLTTAFTCWFWLRSEEAPSAEPELPLPGAGGPFLALQLVSRDAQRPSVSPQHAQRPWGAVAVSCLLIGSLP